MTSTAVPKTTLNKFEKLKAEKDGLLVKNEIEQFAQIGWEAMDELDRDYRLKWLGVFFRPVTPGKFMMRLRIPNGILTSGQMRTLGEIIQRYGDEGKADITTRQNIQLRGICIQDLPVIFKQLQAAGLTSIQSGMDNVRNITGSPVAGIDADELIDTRGLCRQVQDMITNNGEGNPAFTNLPRKFNIAIAGCRDNSVHAEINDLAFIPAYKNGVIGFNIIVGGFFSAKACIEAIPLNAWVEPKDVVAVCEAILIVFRDNGPRANRQKSRVWYLIEEWGIEKFRAEVEKQLGFSLQSAAEKDEIIWEKRDHLGIHPQKQPGLSYIGLHIPVGRMYAQDMLELARISEVYGSGEIRLTVEENLIIPNVPDSRIAPLLKEPLLQRFTTNPSNLARGLVSCTGAQFCNFALVETKNRAMALIQELEQELIQPQPVRIHWTGCPNSCGQPQVAEIGLMGTKVRKDGRTLEGVDIYMGGRVGKDAHLGSCVMKSIPCEDLKPILRNILIENFGAIPTKETNDYQAAVTSQPSTVTKPQTGVVVFAQSGKEVSCNADESILDAAEKAGLNLDYSCRAGNCGTCKQKLATGEVQYEGTPDGLDESDRTQGYVLACIGKPVGKVVLDC